MKIRALFLAFDADEGGTIDRKELVHFLQSAIIGLCKMCGLPIPIKSVIVNYSHVVF
jgi:hypothetical protein